jgi:hypothetical protein
VGLPGCHAVVATCRRQLRLQPGPVWVGAACLHALAHGGAVQPGKLAGTVLPAETKPEGKVQR